MATRDYSNMPTIDLDDEASINKAKAQILHQEPLVLNLPNNLDLNVQWDNFSCHFDEDQGIHFDCDGGNLIAELAKTTQTYDLSVLSKACVESGSQVDVDVKNNRLIFHD